MNEEILGTLSISKEDMQSCAVLSTHIDAVIRGEEPNKAIAALVISLSELAHRSFYDLHPIDGIEDFAHRVGNSVRLSMKILKEKKEK